MSVIHVHAFPPIFAEQLEFPAYLHALLLVGVVVVIGVGFATGDRGASFAAGAVDVTAPREWG